MRKLIVAVVAVFVAMGVTPLVAVTPASAAPACTDPFGLGMCRPGGPCEQAHNCWGESPQAPVTRPPQTPKINPPSSPPPAPTTVPAQAPRTTHSSTGAPRTGALVPPPKGLDAPPQAVAAAKAAPATRIDPANPPKPPTQENFAQRAQNMTSAHNGNIERVRVGNQTLARPRHWGYLDYDEYHRPSLYNPLSEAMTFRYFYSGAYREAYLPAGGRIVLDVSVAGVFPFTAVSDNYLVSGSFNGGAFIPPQGWGGPPPATYTPPTPPTVYRDVSARIPAANQTVQVGEVLVVGHDASQPAGSQDTFLIDDSTLAWGQVDDPRNGGQVSVVKTQSLPGVGPTDDGSILVQLTAQQQPADPWWPWALGGALLLVAAGVVAWVVVRRKRSAELTVAE
jgi:hypothetical protein